MRPEGPGPRAWRTWTKSAAGSPTLVCMSADSARSRLRAGVAAAIAVAVVAAALVGVWQPWHRAATPPNAAASGEGSSVVDAEPLALPADASVLVFGDSWTFGSAAEPGMGYAYVLESMTGWDTTVAGVRGSGYLREGVDGPTFGERIEALDGSLDPDLVIVQGSINDRLLVPDGYDRAVTSAWDALAARYPDARIVILGPAPHQLPVHRGTVWIDQRLGELAAKRGWWYISPLQEEWIQSWNYLDVIDTGLGQFHPSTAGHAYLAARLTQALAERSIVADAAPGAEPEH